MWLNTHSQIHTRWVSVQLLYCALWELIRNFASNHLVVLQLQTHFWKNSNCSCWWFFLFWTCCCFESTIVYVNQHSRNCPPLKKHKNRKLKHHCKKEFKNTFTFTPLQHFPCSPPNSVLPIPCVLQLSPPCQLLRLGWACVYVCGMCFFWNTASLFFSAISRSILQQNNTSCQNLVLNHKNIYIF